MPSHTTRRASKKKHGRRIATACNTQAMQAHWNVANKQRYCFVFRCAGCVSALMHLNVSWLHSLNCAWQCVLATTANIILLACLPACLYLRSMFLSSWVSSSCSRFFNFAYLCSAYPQIRVSVCACICTLLFNLCTFLCVCCFCSHFILALSKLHS